MTNLQKPTKQYRDLGCIDWRWEEGVLDTGNPAFFLRVRYKAKPIVITKVLKDYGATVEWGVYAKGGLIGVAASWDDAMTLVEATLALLEAAHG